MVEEKNNKNKKKCEHKTLKIEEKRERKKSRAREIPETIESATPRPVPSH